uniref:DUF7164 domain-containing protein n=1 Tax=Toxoplasma gondii COUG TaxID=1074873 RepID=A0A2G8Y970_TOXGO|nr:hypothetical protein TGCOUG_223900 [Toxoplasma gondii COUG]
MFSSLLSSSEVEPAAFTAVELPQKTEVTFALDDRLLSCPWQVRSGREKRKGRFVANVLEEADKEKAKGTSSNRTGAPNTPSPSHKTRGCTLAPAVFFQLGSGKNESPSLDFSADLEAVCNLVREEEQGQQATVLALPPFLPLSPFAKAKKPEVAIVSVATRFESSRSSSSSHTLTLSGLTHWPPPVSVAYTRAVLSRPGASIRSQKRNTSVLLPGVDYPATRVFMLYVPRPAETTEASLTQIDQAFGFIESWRYTFSVSQDERKETVVLPNSRLPPEFSQDALTGENLFFASTGAKKTRRSNSSRPRDRWRPTLVSASSNGDTENADEPGENRELQSKRTHAVPNASSVPASSLPVSLRVPSSITSSPGSSAFLPSGSREAGEEAVKEARTAEESALHTDFDLETLFEGLPDAEGAIGSSTVLKTPVVNDVLLVVDPRIPRPLLPWICDELDDLGGLDGMRADLQQRLQRGLSLRQRSKPPRSSETLQKEAGIQEKKGTGEVDSTQEEKDVEEEVDKESRPEEGGRGERRLQDFAVNNEKARAAKEGFKRKLAVPGSGSGETKDTESEIQQHRCIIVRVLLDETQENPSWTQKHPAMHSVSALTHPIVAWLMGQYDLGMRSDNDAFLSPALLRNENTPWMCGVKETGEVDFSFFTGWGGYNSETNRKVLPEYSRLLKLRHQHVHNIGSTWYGRPVDIIRIARLTVKVGNFLMNADPVFVRRDGEWPVWYRGVLLLYSAEIAVNHLVDKHRLFVRKDLLDTSASEAILWSTSPGLHIHCWHTPDFFSKHKFGDGGYNEAELFRSPNFDFEDVRWYSFVNAANGKRRRLLQLQEEVKRRGKPHRRKDTHAPLSWLLDAVLVQAFSLCPSEKPYAQKGGKMCCKYKSLCSRQTRQSQKSDDPCCRLEEDAAGCVLQPCRDWSSREAGLSDLVATARDDLTGGAESNTPPITEPFRREGNGEAKQLPGNLSASRPPSPPSSFQGLMAFRKKLALENFTTT